MRSGGVAIAYQVVGEGERDLGAAAQAGDVLVSRTVTDLVAGSGIEFDERGSHDLRELHAVVR